VGRDFKVHGFGLTSSTGLPRRKPAMRYSSTSGGAGTMAEKVVAGSVPMARLLPCGLRGLWRVWWWD